MKNDKFIMIAFAVIGALFMVAMYVLKLWFHGLEHKLMGL